MKSLQDKYFFITNGSHIGDACWASSWLYSSYCVVGKYNLDNQGRKNWKDICELDPDPIKSVENFLRDFSKYCMFSKGLRMHPYVDAFSRDQLAPLLLLLTCVAKYQSHLKLIARPIVQHIVNLDIHFNGKLHPSYKKSKINDANRYMISKVADVYNIPYKKRKSLFYFESAINVYAASWKNQSVTRFVGSIYKIVKGINSKRNAEDYVNARPYTIWNNLGLLTLLAVIFGKNDRDVKRIAKNFRWFYNNGWGPAYGIISNIDKNCHNVAYYKTVETSRNHDVRILHNDGKDHRRKVVNGGIPSLDYPILRALQSIWG